MVLLLKAQTVAFSQLQFDSSMHEPDVTVGRSVELSTVARFCDLWGS